MTISNLAAGLDLICQLGSIAAWSLGDKPLAGIIQGIATLMWVLAFLAKGRV